MIERFYRELGRVMGTPADPVFWARNFGCAPEGAAHIIRQLIAEGRAVQRGDMLYRR